MVTIHRESGFRFVIFTDDHPPPHVHVFGDGAAKIALGGEDGPPELSHSEGMKAGDVRKAMRIVAERQQEMIERWNDFHDRVERH